MDTNTSSVYMRKLVFSCNDMLDDELMLFLFFLVYVCISNNHCKFLTNSKNSKSNDIIHILIVNKRKGKVAFVSINR